MTDSIERAKLFSRRAFILGVGKTALISTLLGRMYYLQVMRSSHYRTLADGNRIKPKFLAPERGFILDRYGKPLAINRPNYFLSLVPEETEDVQKVLQRVQKMIHISDEEMTALLEHIKRSPSFVPTTLKENLTWEEVSKIEVNAPDLPGTSVSEGLKREYPYKEHLSHVLGYVQPLSDKDTLHETFFKLPGFRVGRTGVEKEFDATLRGIPGVREVEVNARHRVIRELSLKKATPGRETYLSLDLDLQRFTHTLLEEKKSAAVVCLHIPTGEVRAMCSVPSFDPTLFVNGISKDDWKSLISNPYGILNNKATSGQYAPGSTIKPLMVLAALQSGLISPQRHFSCPGYYKLGSHRFHCWKRGGHGAMDMESALAGSCDVYFYQVAKLIGIERIEKMAKHFGLGMPTGLDFPGEKSGLFPSKAWKREKKGKRWYPGETLITSIGQGYVLSTPLQLALMAARLASGLNVLPTLVRQALTQKPFASLEIPSEHQDLILRGMRRVVVGPGGTARRAEISQSGMHVAGKTGTSQVRRITMRERRRGLLSNAEREWRERDHALFIGYAPFDNPEYAVSVLVEHGGGGSRTASPIAREVLWQAQKLGVKNANFKP